MAFKFKGVDFIQFDGLLSGDELLSRDTTRQFVEDNVIPIIEQCNRDGRFPRELIQPMGQLGFFGASLEGYGCAGMSNVEYGLVMQELERGDSGLRSFVSVQSALVMYPIYTFGSDAQKEAWLPSAGDGRKIGVLRADRARLRLEPGRYAHPRPQRGRRLHPQRRENVDHLGLHRRRGRDLGQGGRRRGQSPRLSGGNQSARFLRLRCAWQVVAASLRHLRAFRCRMCASRHATCCPARAGSSHPLCASTRRATASVGERLGAAMSCYDTALQYSLLRKQFREEPIASHQLVQEKLTWMISEITKGQLLALQVGRLKDAGKVGFEHISMAKRNNVWMALECARMARDILGGNGITDDYPVMRHMMNLESVKTYEGTHDIHALIIGQSITGIPAY